MQLFKAILLAYVFYFRKDSSKDKSVPVNNNVGPTTNTNEDGAITNNWVLNQEIHRPKNLSNSRLKRVADMANLTELKAILTPILVPRVAGTPGNEAVRNHIIGRLQSLPGWHIESHSFTDTAPPPFRETNFTNIIATHNINAPRRLVLACHHDSKYMEPDTTGKMFVGATDSAVPCAMLIHLAENLHSYIASKSLDFSELTIQLLFFDGEEAFVRWTSYDSIYGSRKLAARMADTPHSDTQSGKKEIDAIDVFVLLDLIGEQSPEFHNYFPDETTKLYSRMQRLEKKLDELNKLESYTGKRYFGGSQYRGSIQDDHVPFETRGVKILHLIPVPFPNHWHKLTDDESNLHYPTIMNLQKIVQAFVAEYMRLDV